MDEAALVSEGNGSCAVIKRVIEFVPDRTAPPDAGWGWLVCAGSFAIHFVVLGLVYAFGVFLVPMEDDLNASRAAVSWITSVNNFVMLMAGPVTGYLADKYGHRFIGIIGVLISAVGSIGASFCTTSWQMYLVFSIPVGIGFSCAFLPTLSLLGMWFKKRRGLATGIAVAGSGIGTIAIPPVAEYLSSNIGWRDAMRALGELLAVVGLVAQLPMVVRRDVVEGEDAGLVPGRKRSGAARSFAIPWHVFRDPFFLAFYLCRMCSTYGYFIPYVHIVAYAQDYGISQTDAAYLISIMGAASTIGRVSFGLLADLVGRIRVFQLSMAMISASYLLWLFSESYWALSVFAAIFGLFSGSLVSMIPPIMAEHFDHSTLSTVMGFAYTASGTGALLGAPITGFVYDRTDSYSIGILLGFAVTFVGFAMSLVLKRAISMRKPSESSAIEP